MTDTKPTPNRPTLGVGNTTTAVVKSPRDRLFDALEHAFPSWSHRHAIVNALADFVKSPQGFPAPTATAETKGETDE